MFPRPTSYTSGLTGPLTAYPNRKLRKMADLHVIPVLHGPAQTRTPNLKAIDRCLAAGHARSPRPRREHFRWVQSK